MTAKRREFINRLLRISEINQELLEFGDKNRQPAYTKRIKLVQMGKAEFNLPQPSPTLHAPKHNCKVFIVDKHSQRYHSQGKNPCPCSPSKNQGFSPQPNHIANKIRIDKRKSNDSYFEREPQCINFVSSIQCELRQQITKHTEDYTIRRPQSQYKNRKGPSSLKNLVQSDGQSKPHFSSNNSPHKMISGKSIKLNRSNTVNFQRDKALEQERKAKIQRMKQINKNYAGPFNPPPKLTAKSYIIGEVLPNGIRPVVCCNSKNSQQVASLTKIMTCMVTIELADMLKIDMQRQEIKIGKYESCIGGTSAEIKPGQIYTVRQLLYGLMLPSGNDASLALAVWGGRKLIQNSTQPIEGSLTIEILLKKLTKGTCFTRFIKEMNDKAKKLNMTKTKYANSHGLANPNNRSTAYDIALLSSYAMKNPVFREVVSCRSYQATIKYQVESSQVVQVQEDDNQQYQNGEQKNQKKAESPEKRSNKKLEGSQSAIQKMEVGWENTHKLLHSRPNEYIGIKTGITATAGPCLSSMIKVQNKQFVIIVLACFKTGLRFKQTQILKRWLYKHENLMPKMKRTSSLKPQKPTEDDYSQSGDEEYKDGDD